MVVLAEMLAQTPRTGRNISLSSRELRKLRSIRRDRKETEERRLAVRVVLRAATGQSNQEIANVLEIEPGKVNAIRDGFARCRFYSLEDQAGCHAPCPEVPVVVKQPPRVKLTGHERRELKRLVQAHKSEQRMVLRARIVLAAATGRNNCEIADELQCDVKTVRKWRSRFVKEGMIGLYDLPRAGRPPRFDAGQRHDVIATILGPAPAPRSRWTLDLAVEALIDRGIVSSICRETISRWLRTADIKPHRCRYWLNSKDPEFTAKMHRVVDLYINKPRCGRVICIDEKTCIQARESRHPDKPARPGRTRKKEFEYKRHGVVHLIAAFDVHTGRVFAVCIKGSNNSEAFVAFLRELRKVYPREKLYLVLDNGTTHCSKATTEFLAKYPRLIPVFLPIHASWLNQIEIWFSVLTRQALKGASVRSQDELIRLIQDYVESYNRTAKVYRWTKTGQPLQR